jgi:hypothetical protein
MGDLRPEVVAIVVVLWPLGIPILLRGVALLQQSFGETGYFRADTDGIELRIGAPSLYTRLIAMIPQIRWLPANPDTFAIRFPEDGARLDGGGYVYRFRWNKIAAFDVSLFAFVIELRSGARLLLRRFYFAESPVTIGRRPIRCRMNKGEPSREGHTRWTNGHCARSRLEHSAVSSWRRRSGRRTPDRAARGAGRGRNLALAPTAAPINAASLPDRSPSGQGGCSTARPGRC